MENNANGQDTIYNQVVKNKFNVKLYIKHVLMDQTGRIQRIKVSPLHFTVGTSQNWSLLGWKCVSDIYL